MSTKAGQVHTAEQQAVIDAPLGHMSVIACPGSGKTFTAVRRLRKVRELLGDSRSRALLLSFSNTAVDTFRRSYRELAIPSLRTPAMSRVDIETLDGFITRNVLLPHAYRTMGASKAAYLVTGNEAFLERFKVWTGTYPLGIEKLQVRIENGAYSFAYQNKAQKWQHIDAGLAAAKIAALGRVGAYTHSLGRYWALRSLQQESRLVGALARRYPEILIDEAQDIGSVHQAIIELLLEAGSRISLIGDPNQAIYEFADADGSFLRNFGKRADTREFSLTNNYRSVPAIVEVVNALAKRSDTTRRSTTGSHNGVFYLPYDDSNALIANFCSVLTAVPLAVDRSAVLCRGRDVVAKVARGTVAQGSGRVERLAYAAILRDAHRDMARAFELVVATVIGLLTNPPDDLVNDILRERLDETGVKLRRLLWGFTRDAVTGLPPCSLSAKTEWHPKLVTNIKTVLGKVSQIVGAPVAKNLGNKLAKKGLKPVPLFDAVSSASDGVISQLRVDTVHRAKGESLDAILFIASASQIREMLSGVGTEEGRIGYVALSRAREIAWVGIPSKSLPKLASKLSHAGIEQWPSTKP